MSFTQELVFSKHDLSKDVELLEDAELEVKQWN